MFTIFKEYNHFYTLFYFVICLSCIFIPADKENDVPNDRNDANTEEAAKLLPEVCNTIFYFKEKLAFYYITS